MFVYAGGRWRWGKGEGIAGMESESTNMIANMRYVL